MVQNESNAAGEADYCDVQFPLSLSVATTMTSGPVFGQVYEAGVTEAAGAGLNVRAQLGFGPATANPQYEPGWHWSAFAHTPRKCMFPLMRPPVQGP